MDGESLFSPIQEIKDVLLEKKQVRLYLKRDDLIHPHISGNKWRKLKYNLEHIKHRNIPKLLTFGGAFSNHIAATAAAGKKYEIPTIGIIRGEKTHPLNPTLLFAKGCGMRLEYISRTQYRQKDQPSFQQELKEKYGEIYILPEGGTNELAVKGCMEIIEEARQQLKEFPDYFCSSCGTGGTISGIIAALEGERSMIGFSALKGDFLQGEVSSLLKKCGLPSYSNWQINTTYHFGGYAKWKPNLIAFINKFKENHEVQLDPIYTGKMLYGIYDLVEQNYFEKGTSILAIHTGGLQGIEGFNRRFGDLLR